jgi:hypothetical protein
VVAGVRMIQPQSQVLLLGILPRGQDPDDPVRQEIRDTNALVSQLDDHNMVRYLDIGQDFLNPDGSIPQSLLYDYTHPSVQGYQVMTWAIWPALSWMLDNPPSDAVTTPTGPPAVANAALPSLSAPAASPAGAPAATPAPTNPVPPPPTPAPTLTPATNSTAAPSDAPAAEKLSLDLTALTEALWFSAITASTVTH